MENIKTLSYQEMQEIEGGIAPFIIAGAYIAGSFVAGLTVGAVSAHIVYELSH
ncbi:class IIb bacteriocin, lactobin A/cerein 7B family [Candidatus Ornithobacterium hominis]|uniref:Class IIb bacteriocin, lactobin A/cerein 7B family n=1 Tax=Candidatus Ornithobacterium hominis TaxID=2497989 RepID=A0A383U1V8_9FLAO|nr:class IIb bacteriocin, lactobin A/cerein 7B family [Candidatus Ornithobacterium hominis]MCT7904741.1 class IIb bacteriocin, lactobin A/cerein 7B family [Candidatus Ornithobacterium hominis]SZD73912.1 class IIb bacteriocin, lactobin A/cerein 7B family [Candidatus Ornithobacterium hominis]